jgi:hypothetical protein
LIIFHPDTPKIHIGLSVLKIEVGHIVSSENSAENRVFNNEFYYSYVNKPDTTGIFCCHADIILL